MLRACRALVRRSLERPDPRHRVDLLLRQLLEPREHRLQHRGVLRLVRQVRRLASIQFQVVEDRAALELRVGAFRRWRGVQRAGGIRAVNPSDGVSPGEDLELSDAQCGLGWTGEPAHVPGGRRLERRRAHLLVERVDACPQNTAVA